MTVSYLDAKRVQGSSGSGGSGSPNSEGTTPTVDSTNTAIYGVNSLSYDGANDGNNTQSASAVLPSGFTKCTISCWLRANEFNNDYAVILKGNPNTNDNDWVGIQAVSGGFKATVGSDSGSQVSCTSSGVSADEWHLVVLIYDGTESSSNDRLKLYVDDDAVVQPSSGTVNTSNDYAPYLCIGQIGTNQDNNTYKGNAQDVGIWNIALTEANVDTLYGTKSGTGNAGSSTTGVAISDASLGTGLRCYYKLDSTTIPNSADDKATLVTSFPDSLGSSADGTLIGDPAQDTTPTPPTGLGTSSFYFDGNDAIDIDGAEPFSTTVGSVSLWFYNDGTSESKVICCFADTDATAQLLFETKTNGIMCKVRSSSTTYWEIRRNSGNNGGALSTGWHHIVASQDGTAVKVYVDGTYINTDWDDDSDKSKWMLTEIDNGRIGCVNKNSSGNSDFFTGNCMEIGLWNVALTQAQVTSLYNVVDSVAVGRKATSEPTGLRAYYPLSGTTVTNDLADYSNLPENTIFNETDTYSQWWLQDAKWIMSSPKWISDLTAWYDASDLNSVTKDSSNLVSQINDKSGNGYHLTESSAKPLWVDGGQNNLDVVDFASSKEMKAEWASKSQPTTICAVLKTPTSTSSQQNLWDNYDNTNDSMGFVNRDGSDTYLQMFAPSSLNEGSGDTPYSGTWTFFVNTYDDSDSSMRINGVEKATGTVGTNPSYGLTLSNHRTGSTYGNIILGEFMVFDKALSASEITDVNNYFSKKWGITIGS